MSSQTEQTTESSDIVKAFDNFDQGIVALIEDANHKADLEKVVEDHPITADEEDDLALEMAMYDLGED